MSWYILITTCLVIDIMIYFDILITTCLVIDIMIHFDILITTCMVIDIMIYFDILITTCMVIDILIYFDILITTCMVIDMIYFNKYLHGIVDRMMPRNRITSEQRLKQLYIFPRVGTWCYVGRTKPVYSAELKWCKSL